MTKVKIERNTDMHLKFIKYRMWHPSELTTKEEDELFSFQHMAEALDKVHKSLICAKSKNNKKMLKNC